MSDPVNDLTRWNRAGLPRFRYVDGNAVTWLEELRLALLSRNLEPLLDPNQADPAARLDWWEKIWRTPPADPSGQAFVKQVLDAAEGRLLWQAPEGSGPLWVRPPVRPELETEWSTRLREQYEAGRGDLAWEIVRSFARGVHLLTEHLDAYANEGYLGTATQWENVRRLIAMLDVRPAPPASASTVLALEAKASGTGTIGTVAKGFQIQHSPQDGGAPVIFETLEDLEVDPLLNALRPLDHDRNPDALQGSRIELEGRVKGLKAGEPLVLEDERSGDLHAYLIQSVSEGETVTRVEVSPAVKSGVPKGWARIHATPRERLAPLAPASRGAEVGKSLHLAEEPAGLQPGDVVWISDGHQPVYRRVEQVRGRRLILDAELGELRTDLTVVGRPIVLPVTDIGRREVRHDNSGTLEVTILAIRVAGDWTRLANEWLADKKVGGSTGDPLPLFQVISTDYRPVGSVIGNEGQLDPNGGYTVLRLQWTHQSNLANPQALLAPPPGGGLWRADRFLEKSFGKLPAEITSALPKKAAAGDVAVVASGSTLAWTRLMAIEADADAGTALLRADEGGWRDRGGGPFFLAETRVFTKFERAARVAGWSANATPFSGTEVPLPAAVLSASAALRPGRMIVVELDDQPAAAMAARVIAVAAGNGGNAGKLTLDRALPAEARCDNLVLRANAVLAGHGEAKDERALGSGDASQSHQTFQFEETGVSFVADPGQPSGVRAAIEVRIGNRLWQQVPTLADSGPADPHYTVRMTEDGGVELTFGDGRNGRRLPSGVNNVRLAWRSGTGLAGNLPAGRLVKAARPNPLIEAVRQPLPATGGNDMEGVESMRATAPASVSTLGRAVSLADYGRLAASQSSVWQAAAFALPTGLARKDSVRVVVVPAGGGQLGAMAGPVRAFLEAHALPGVSIRVDPYKSLGFALRVELQIVTAEFDPERVADTVRARLLAAFGLRARKLGQALRLSEVFRIVEGVPGVANSLCVLDNDPKKARVDAPADGVVHLDAASSSLTILHREFEL